MVNELEALCGVTGVSDFMLTSLGPVFGLVCH
jgi:hypothetical protein